MKTTSKIFILGLVMVIGLCYANSASAESDVATGAAAQSAGAGASARLNFQIEIPRFIYLRVGQAGLGIDTVRFDPTAEQVAEGTAGITGTAGSGSVYVSLISNAGGVTITPTNSNGNGLSDGGATPNYISYGQIETASNVGALQAPELTNAGGTSVSITPNISANVTNISATWTYTYDNPTDPPAAGTYTGQVTYTAAIP